MANQISANDEGEQLQNEMKVLGLPEETIQERTEQIYHNRDLSRCAVGAAVILKFKKRYKLKGDFDAIKDIASVSYLIKRNLVIAPMPPKKNQRTKLRPKVMSSARQSFKFHKSVCPNCN